MAVQKDSTDKNTGLNDVNMMEVEEDATPDTPKPAVLYKCQPTPSIKYIYYPIDPTNNVYGAPFFFGTNNGALHRYPPNIPNQILLDHNYCKRRLEEDDDSDDDRLVIVESDEIFDEDDFEDHSYTSKYKKQEALDRRNLPHEELPTEPRVQRVA